MKDYAYAKEVLQNLLYALNIRVTDVSVRCAGLNGGHNLLVSFETKKGSYEIPCVWNGTLREEYLLRHDIFKRNRRMNRFVNDILFSILVNMGKQNDTDPMEVLYIALCAFWDPFFVQSSKSMGMRFKDGWRELVRLVWKNPTAMSDARRTYNSPNDFTFFVTSSIGNTLYYFSDMHQRRDLQRVIAGEIY